jgi:iron(III) transport system permease protein
LKNSVFLGIVGATIGIVLSIFIAYTVVKVRTAASGVLDFLSFLSFSFPIIFVALCGSPVYPLSGPSDGHTLPTFLMVSNRLRVFLQTHRTSGGLFWCGAPYYTHEGSLSRCSSLESFQVIWYRSSFGELSLQVLSRPGTEVLAVQILRFAEDGLWGKLSALGIIMIFVSTTLVILASLIGVKFTKVRKEG